MIETVLFPLSETTNGGYWKSSQKDVSMLSNKTNETLTSYQPNKTNHQHKKVGTCTYYRSIVGKAVTTPYSGISKGGVCSSYKTKS